MADLAASAVTVEDDWYEGGEGGPRRLKCKQLVLNLTGQGSASNLIPASVLGLTKIVEATSAVKFDDSVGVTAFPDYTQDNLLLKNAGSNAPADYTGQFRITVRGT